MYDFKSLSDVDFEFIARDLLQKELGITLESFTSGRDNGIDLRYSRDASGALVVQCKHYRNSKYADLKSILKREELKKIKNLNPSRYILATSLGLTPTNKKELFDLLDPYCLSEADIYGREDLNNLLTKFPAVEKTHFKLWLTGTTVLERILHGAIFNQTAFETEKITKKLKLYVQNESYEEAVKILESDRYCIIAGIPGIGKTTLAEVLLIHYLNLDYEAFIVDSDISEAYTVYKSGQKQVFFYDDFLGQTSLEEKFNKNEEQKLLRFIETVKNSKDARFVLTTREYILNQAKFAYEKLDRSHIDVNKCVVSLDKYTTYDKARILYNHLYFSDLPTEYKRALIVNQNYREIIEHENYSPRVVEWMTLKGEELDIAPAAYFEHFIANLDNPTELWEHAYEYQLSNAARHLILLLGTMPGEVLLEDLEAAFDGYYEFSTRKRNFQIGQNDFRNALKESESNFIRTEKKSARITVRFHNPSIRDFTEHRLMQDPRSLRELCACATFYEQLTAIWNLCARRLEQAEEKTGDKHLFVKEPAEFLQKLRETFSQEGCNIKTFVRSSNATFVEKINLFENRVAFAVKAAKSIFADDSAVAASFLQPFFELVQDRITNRLGQKEDLIFLLSATKKCSFGKALLSDEFLASAKTFSTAYFHSSDDFKHFLSFDEEFKNLITPEEWVSVSQEFEDFAVSEINSVVGDSESDAAGAEWLLDELKDLNRKFDVEIQIEIQELEDFIAEKAQALDANDKPLRTPEPEDAKQTFTDEDIDNIFDSLLDAQ